ncbi:hypothetical protein [Bowmanella dokdonensis]|uniref:Uncharacterized protein n=1 Tax=Bowmanella dokdonensis TaxID=751969 RepID=A0A939DKT1_9ALTE|nr:hypothetical protein [Bowmanella dokdonensis]MBN7824127.1 hypothetical protein [Bowmanella dokdonensis]
MRILVHILMMLILLTGMQPVGQTMPSVEQDAQMMQMDHGCCDEPESMEEACCEGCDQFHCSFSISSVALTGASDRPPATSGQGSYLSGAFHPLANLPADLFRPPRA